MTKSTKYILIICICIFITCSGTVGLVFFWIRTSGQRIYNEINETAKSSANEGTAFGRTTDENGCLLEAVNRLNIENSISDKAKIHLFLAYCIRTSKPSAGFCSNIPARTAIIDTAKWAQKRCNDIGSKNEDCVEIMSTVQRVCTEESVKSGNKVIPQ